MKTQMIAFNFTALSLLAGFSMTVFASEIVVRSEAASEFENIRTSERTKTAAGQTINLSASDPYFVKIENHLPVFLLPIASEGSELKLKSLPLKEAFSTQSQKEVNHLLSDVMLKVGAIQGLAKQRKIDAALSKFNELQSLYPDLTFLKFVRASLVFLQGQKDEAIRLTREGLKEHPDYEDGRTFLKEIEGAGT